MHTSTTAPGPTTPETPAGWELAFRQLYAAQRYDSALIRGDDTEIHRTRRAYDAASAALIAHRRGTPSLP